MNRNDGEGVRHPVAKDLHPRPLPYPTRRRPGGARVLAALLVLVVVAVAVGTQVVHNDITGTGVSFARDPYVPQPERNAEWTGNPGAKLSDHQIDTIATESGIEVLPKFAAGFNLQDQFADASAVVSAAKAKGNPIQVYAYFNASYWYAANQLGWGHYADGFSQDWLLHDASGQPIPFYGQRNQRQIGDVLDLSNPDFRAWAVATIVDWMKQAPFAGVAFDSANPLLPTAALRQGVGAGRAGGTYSSLLCTSDSSGCSTIDAWNAGLQDLISSTTSALRAMGKQVIYNGIAPSTQRAGRNLDTLAHADTAANEAFCYASKQTVDGDTKLTPTSLTDDAAVTKQAAADGKSILQITNYGTTDGSAIGDYCLAGFLMGWVPGHSWWIFHQGYADPLNGQYPEVAEQDLALGSPTAAYRDANGLLSRQFEHGFVAVNTTNSDTTVRVPSKGVAFADGIAGDTLAAGKRVTVPAQGSLFVLYRTYLDGK